MKREGTHMLVLSEISPDHEVEWDRIVLSSPRGLLFHLIDWLEIVREYQGLQLLRLGIFDGQQLTGVFPLFLKRLGPLKIAASPFVVEDTHYMGPVVDDALLPEVMVLFVDYMRTQRIHYARIIFH